MKLIYTKDKKFYGLFKNEEFSALPVIDPDWIVIDAPADYNGFITDLDIDVDAKTAVMNVDRKEERAVAMPRQKAYTEETDHLFREAVREKLLGNDAKWNVYIGKINSIKTRFPKKKRK